MKGTVVSPQEAEQSLKTYWGYDVVVAETISHLLSLARKNSYKILLDDNCQAFKKSSKTEIVKEIQKKECDEILIFFGNYGLEYLMSHEEGEKTPVDVIEKKFDSKLGNWTDKMGVKRMFMDEQIGYFLQELLD